MKTRFSSLDIVAIINEFNKTIVNMRVAQVYDIDNKTYLFKLALQEDKATLLVESGIRIHTTAYEWPKNPAPSGFTMKLRKHLKNKRLEKITQLGIDRIVDMQFGINEAAYHVIVELYDRGNIVLTDCEYTVLNILRPRTTGNEDVKFIVREKYPIDLARPPMPPLTEQRLAEVLATAKEGDTLRKNLSLNFMYGPAILDHVLLGANISSNSKIGNDLDLSSKTLCIFEALKEAETIMEKAKTLECEGYLIQKKETSKGGIDQKEIVTNLEFHPLLFRQHEKLSYTEYSSFDKAVDYFFSNLESQKIDIRALQKEKEAIKKLENIKKDQKQRIDILQKSQIGDTQKAQLIEMNLELVEKALLIIQTAIANQISWTDIWDLIQEAKSNGNPVAKSIKKLKFETNHFSMLLSDPYKGSESDNETSDDTFIKPQLVDIDLDLSAYANARKYYDLKRFSSKKEQKTVESSVKVYKIAEKKTRETLKEVALTSTITKARKVFWFEKFLWFVSSENYLVIAGRDIQQNEVLVKRYMKPGDIYVHADLHGASSIIIKNPSSEPIPPKTLNEAGTMAVCYSAAWNAKVVTSAWWVYHHQVSKTAPSGEYLTAGSFMIRGKKNYLPPSHLIMGFGFMFKLDEDSIDRHSEERKVKKDDDESASSETLEADEEVLENLEEDSSDSEAGQDEIDGYQPLSNEDTQDTEAFDLLPISMANHSICDQIIPVNDENNKESHFNEEDFEFPDTEIKLPHIGGKQEEMEINNSAEEELIVYLGDDKPVVVKPAPMKCKDSHKKHCAEKKNQEELQDAHQGKQIKRGQKSKLKKIKEKYRDQDEEERNLRMKILASAGATKGKKGKDTFEKGGGKNAKNSKKQPKKKAASETPVILHDAGDNFVSPVSPPDDVQESSAQFDDEKEETLDDGIHISEELKILSSLTGCPFSEDTLMFSVPVCAPYAAMTNYKYKVKVMPGNGRRGKGAKTAVHIFLHDKTSTQREKDLLRSVKDQDISRNLPGKLKLAAPNLSKLKYGR